MRTESVVAPAPPSRSPASDTSRRIMRGQQAAVCGLILAGVSFTQSCEIVGSCYSAMRPYIPDGWAKHGGRKVSRWKGEELADLKELYDNRTLTLERIAALFGTSGSNIREVAKRKGWARRRWVAPKPIRTLSRQQQTTYWKIRPILGGHRAYVEVTRNAP